MQAKKSGNSQHGCHHNPSSGNKEDQKQEGERGGGGKEEEDDGDCACRKEVEGSRQGKEGREGLASLANGPGGGGGGSNSRVVYAIFLFLGDFPSALAREKGLLGNSGLEAGEGGCTVAPQP